jgi:hypothetical protein
VGGPVVFIAGSLLDRYMPSTAPGRARDMIEARHKCERLRDGDRAFARAIVASQAALRERYLPESVWPRFDEAMRSLLTSDQVALSPLEVAWSEESSPPPSAIVILAHHAALTPILGRDGYEADNPTVARLIQLMRNILSECPDRRFSITCLNEGIAGWLGLLSEYFDPSSYSLLSLGRALPTKIPAPAATAAPRRDVTARVRSAARRWLPEPGLRRLDTLAASIATGIATQPLRSGTVISLCADFDQGLGGRKPSAVRLYAESRSDEELTRLFVPGGIPSKARAQ